MSKITCSMVFDFTYDESEVVHILSDPSPKDALQIYMEQRHGVAGGTRYVGTYNSEELAKALGKHLAEAKISEAKQIPLSTGGSAA